PRTWKPRNRRREPDARDAVRLPGNAPRPTTRPLRAHRLLVLQALAAGRVLLPLRLLPLTRTLAPSGEANFSADHVEPQSHAPLRICDYTNLLYACLTCNSTRQNRDAPDPCAVAFGAMLRVREDGTVEGLRPEGDALI